MIPNSKNSSDVSRLLSISAIFLALLAVTVILVIGVGVLDPKPLGGLERVLAHDQEYAVDHEMLEPLLSVEEYGDFTVRVKASWIAGNEDIGYGIGVGTASDSIVTAISPLGYLSVFRFRQPVGTTPSGGGNYSYINPWQTWPHVKQSAEENEIWLDVEDSNLIRVRVNRELLWSGKEPLSGSDISLWGDSFGDAGLIQLGSLELFAGK